MYSLLSCESKFSAFSALFFQNFWILVVNADLSWQLVDKCLIIWIQQAYQIECLEPVSGRSVYNRLSGIEHLFAWFRSDQPYSSYQHVFIHFARRQPYQYQRSNLPQQTIKENVMSTKLIIKSLTEKEDVLSVHRDVDRPWRFHGCSSCQVRFLQMQLNGFFHVWICGELEWDPGCFYANRGLQYLLGIDSDRIDHTTHKVNIFGALDLGNDNCLQSFRV